MIVRKPRSKSISRFMIDSLLTSGQLVAWPPLVSLACRRSLSGNDSTSPVSETTPTGSISLTTAWLAGLLSMRFRTAKSACSLKSIAEVSTSRHRSFMRDCLTGIPLIHFGHAEHQMDTATFADLITHGGIVVRQDAQEADEGDFDTPQRSFGRSLVRNRIGGRRSQAGQEVVQTLE